MTALSVDGVVVPVGDHCRTTSPIDLELSAPGWWASDVPPDQQPGYGKRSKYYVATFGGQLSGSIDIPALSPAAYRVLERVRDAIDRNDLPAALGYAISNREAKAEIDRFNKAIAARFGERTLLTDAAREPSGKVFDKAA